MTAGEDAVPQPPEAPLVQVVRGNPTAPELAALMAVLAARGRGGPPPTAPRRRWADPAAAHRRPLRPGPAGWATNP